MARRKIKWPDIPVDGRSFLGYFHPRGTRELHSVLAQELDGKWIVVGMDMSADTLEDL